MQIQFRQAEIVAALKGYIVAQGINLNGKAVDISFTAGRKEGGLIADVNIEDAALLVPQQTQAPTVLEPVAHNEESVVSNDTEDTKTASLFS
jgi:hypothetical protein